MSITTAGRSLSNDMVTEVSASQLTPILLASLEFSPVIYLWSGYGNLVYNSITYLGTGEFGTISPIEETTDLSSRGISLELSGVSTTLIAEALTEDYQGKNCTVLFGALNSSAALVSTPITIFSGRMDVMNISDDGTSQTLTMTAENRLMDFRRPREVRYTHQEQLQLRASATIADLGLIYVNAIQEKEIYWGNEKLAAPVMSNGGGDYGPTEYA
jgi:hypothetical protein